MLRFRLIITSLIIILIGGCSSLSKEECLRGDWRGIGYKDGTEGHHADRINKHTKACAKHEIRPDFNAYEAGRQQGLEQVYCKPRNGYQLGLGGYRANNVCPPHMEAGFNEAYRYGKDIYHNLQELNSLQVKLRRFNANFAELDQRIIELDKEIHHRQHAKAHMRQHLEQHIHNELAQVNNRIDRKIHRMMNELHLRPKERQALRKATEIAGDKGFKQNRLNWLTEYGTRGKVKHGELHHLRREIDRLEKQKHAQLVAAAMLKFSGAQREQYYRLARLAEYSGELDSQLKTLHRMHKPHRVVDLRRFHYQHELDGVKNHHDNRSAHHSLTLPQLRQELSNAQHERQRLQHDILNVEHQIKDIEHIVDDKKRSSPYQ